MLSITITFDEFMLLWENFKNNKNYTIFLNWVVKRKEGGRMVINSRISSDIKKKIFDSLWPENHNYSAMSPR